ncbi:hypothetical protein SAMN06297144_3303 [Sphingomonas guangdongensis]|uniref:Protease inhibitor Inh n=1 Tax=Sphingomonas guangdongensis TaxID=1141890 RepID=A0A285R320_9SPHN|nr:hypothetical protein [Sphingomonas guangdongensis]SOB88158.1 hypothetical protein SAMN06297144_3303 [Sphingomonas guangdongensis]
MSPVRALLLGALSLTCAAPAADAQRGAGSTRIAQVTVQQRLIIRIPRLPVGRAPLSAGAAPLPPIRWIEKKTDKCVPVVNLAAATITTRDSVDLLLNGGKRLRARFDDDCPAIDFYSGFYVKMPRDGKVCADRDSIRSRSGGECRIESFRALVPAR